MKKPMDNHKVYFIVRIIVSLAIFSVLIFIGQRGPATFALLLLLFLALIGFGVFQSYVHRNSKIQGSRNSTPAPSQSRSSTTEEPDDERRSSTKLYIRQGVFTFGEQFTVYDEQENEKYHAYSEVFELGARFHITDLDGIELADIEKSLFSFRTSYYLNVHGDGAAEIIREPAIFASEYVVSGYGWNISG